MLLRTITTTLLMGALTMASSIAANNDPQAIDRLASAMTQEQLTRLVIGAYKAAADRNKMQMVKKSPAEMPAQFPYVYYAGKDSSGVASIWISSATPPPGDEYSKDYTIAVLFVGADSGLAGREWKAKYDTAPDTLQFGLAIVRSIELANDRSKASARETISWMHRNLTRGMTRTRSYQLLRSRKLVAYNQEFNPGKPFGETGVGSGCDYGATSSRARWPLANEPIPIRKGECAELAGLRSRGVRPNIRSPDAFVDLEDGFNIACGTTITQTLKFDLHDHLTQVADGKPSTVCI